MTMNKRSRLDRKIGQNNNVLSLQVAGDGARQSRDGSNGHISLLLSNSETTGVGHQSQLERLEAENEQLRGGVVELVLQIRALRGYLAACLRIGTEAPHERLGRALALRNAGKTFREIGAEFGVTVERARQMVLQAGLRRGNWAYNLTARARNVLGNYLDVDVTKMDELEAAKAVAATLSPRDLLRLPNVGSKTLEEISAWLDSHGLAPKAAPPRVDRQDL
jgi:hypothetical protein